MRYKIHLVLMFLILTMIVIVRIRLLNIPIDRDEAEYAYGAQLILNGQFPYLEQYSLKLPGMFFIYSVFFIVFGQSSLAIHLGLLISNLVSCILIFKIGKRIFDANSAIVVTSFFAFLTLNENIQGFSANSEHFVILFALSGLFFFYKYYESLLRKHLFLSGVMMALAFVIKQHGIVFMFLGAILFLNKSIILKESLRKIIQVVFIYFLGTLSVVILTLGLVFLYGAFDKFWFLTFTYAREYVSYITIEQGINNFIKNISNIIKVDFLIWIISALGLISCLIYKAGRKQLFFIVSLLITSFIAISPGLYFRPHYFLLIIPVVSLLSGMLFYILFNFKFESNRQFITRLIPYFLFIAVVSIYTVSHSDYLFRLTPVQVSKNIFGSNPFSESPQIAEYIYLNTLENDRVAVIGAEPQILFYSKRMSASGYLYVYPFLEENFYAEQMSHEFFKETEKSKPTYIIFSNHSGTWFGNEIRRNEIMEWLNGYINNGYQKVGIVDIINDSTTNYMWDNEVFNYSCIGEDWLTVYKQINEN